MNIKTETDSKSKESKDEYLIIAIDSTGIKVTSRHQYIRDNWNTVKKGYLKIHVVLNIKTKKNFAMEVTNEHVHDSKALPILVNGL